MEINEKGRMLHRKENRKSDEFREIHDKIYEAYNKCALSFADLETIKRITQQLLKNPKTHFHIPFAEIYERDSEGDYVHWQINH